MRPLSQSQRRPPAFQTFILRDILGLAVERRQEEALIACFTSYYTANANFKLKAFSKRNTISEQGDDAVKTFISMFNKKESR